jgi:tetratricopeptide (TPR) repeat protein
LATASYSGWRLWDARTGEAVSSAPARPTFPGTHLVAFTPDSRKFITASSQGEVSIQQLDGDSRTLDELSLLSEVLSSHRFDSSGSLMPLDSASLREKWQHIRATNPGRQGPSAEAILAWEHRELERCERSQNWSGALQHLDRLASVEADNWRFFYRRGNALAESGRLKQAAADFTRAIELNATDIEVWSAHALAQLGSGDLDAYAAARTGLLNLAVTQASPTATFAVTRVSVLDPTTDKSTDFSDLVRRLAEIQPASMFSTHLLAAAHYRNGELERSLRLLPKQQVIEPLRLRSSATAVQDWLWASLAHARAGRTAEARRWLDDATAWRDYHLSDQDPSLPVFDQGESFIQALSNLVFASGKQSLFPRQRLSWQEKVELRILFDEANKQLAASPPP